MMKNFPSKTFPFTWPQKKLYRKFFSHVPRLHPEAFFTLRHNAYDDEPRTLGWGVVSFRLKEIANQLVGKKGLKIIVNTIYDGKQTYTVDLKK